MTNEEITAIAVRIADSWGMPSIVEGVYKELILEVAQEVLRLSAVEQREISRLARE